jgi:hypothetical protein
MVNSKKIIWMVIAAIIALPVYYLLLISISTLDSESLKNMQYWFFSTIAQFNGAIIGLMLAALGISYIMHSEKTIFLFKKDEFELLRVTHYLFILNALIAFLCLSVLHHEKYIVLLTPLTLIIECIALILLGLFFNKSINIFGREVRQKLRKIESEKIIGDINIEHALDNDKRNILVFVSRNQTFFDIEGVIHPRIYKRMSGPGLFSYQRDIIGIMPKRIPIKSQIKESNRVHLCHIPKEIIESMEVGYCLEWNMLLKFRDRLRIFYYVWIRVVFEKIEDEKLKIIKVPYLQIVDEEAYLYTDKNLKNNPYPVDSSLLFPTKR